MAWFSAWKKLMYQMPNRASRTGAFFSKGALRKWLSCSRQWDADLHYWILDLLSRRAQMNSFSTPEQQRGTYHPMSSWKKLFKVVEAWWGEEVTEIKWDINHLTNELTVCDSSCLFRASTHQTCCQILFIHSHTEILWLSSHFVGPTQSSYW